MLKVITDLKLSKKILIISLLMYFLLYIGRTNFTLTVVYFVHYNILSKAQSGMIGSVYFITYAVGQFVFGFLGDKYSPYKLILVGIIGAAAANTGMFLFSSDYSLMIAFSALNGIMQSIVFPSLYAVFASIDEKYGKKGTKYLMYVYPIGETLCNLLVIAFSGMGNFLYIFLFSALTLAGFSVIWVIVTVNAHKNLTERTETRKTGERLLAGEYSRMRLFNLLLHTGMFIILIVMLMRGVLHNGTHVWVATMISESYNMPPTLSQVLTMVLPLANIIGAAASTFMYGKLKNEMTTMMFFFALIALPFAGLLFIGRISVYASIILLFLVNFCKYGFFQMMLQVPSKFGRIGKAATVAGILNAVSSVGFSISGYVFGLTAELYGWTVIIAVWLAVAVAAVLFCLLCLKSWKKFATAMEAPLPSTAAQPVPPIKATRIE